MMAEQKIGFMRNILLLPFIITLASCGGGGGGGGSIDTLAPTVELTASQHKVLPGHDVSFSYSASDNIDGEISAVLSCNSGSLSSLNLTAPVVAEPTQVDCRLTATDAAGNEASTITSIEVIPVAVTLLDAESAFKTMQPVILSVSGAISSDADYITATLGGESINLSKISESTYSLLPPYGLNGEQQLNFEIDGLSISLPITLEQVEPTDDPLGYVLSETQSIIEQLEAQVSRDASDSNALTYLRDGIAQIDSLSENDVINLAILLNQFPTLQTANSLRTTSVRAINDTDACVQGTAGLIVNTGGLVSGYATMAGGLFITPETGPVGLLLAGMGLYIGQSFKADFRTDLTTVIRQCGIISSINLIPSFTLLDELEDDLELDRSNNNTKENVARLAQRSATANSRNQPALLHLTNNQALVYAIDVTTQHQNQSSGDTLRGLITTLKTTLINIEDYLPGVFGDFVSEIPDNLSYEVDFDASNLQLSGVSNTNIHASISSVNAEKISLLFKFNNVANVDESGREYFEFSLLDTTTNETYLQQAVLSLAGLPVAHNGSYRVLGGQGLYGILQGEFVENFEFIATGDHGTATLLDPTTGQFGYDADENYNGYDTITFVAKNQEGVSEVATIDIQIMDDCPHSIQEQAVIPYYDYEFRADVRCENERGSNPELEYPGYYYDENLAIVVHPESGDDGTKNSAWIEILNDTDKNQIGYEDKLYYSSRIIVTRGIEEFSVSLDTKTKNATLYFSYTTRTTDELIQVSEYKINFGDNIWIIMRSAYQSGQLNFGTHLCGGGNDGLYDGYYGCSRFKPAIKEASGDEAIALYNLYLERAFEIMRRGDVLSIEDSFLFNEHYDEFNRYYVKPWYE